VKGLLLSLHIFPGLTYRRGTLNDHFLFPSFSKSPPPVTNTARLGLNANFAHLADFPVFLPPPLFFFKAALLPFSHPVSVQSQFARESVPSSTLPRLSRAGARLKGGTGVDLVSRGGLDRPRSTSQLVSGSSILSHPRPLFFFFSGECPGSSAVKPKLFFQSVSCSSPRN